MAPRWIETKYYSDTVFEPVQPDDDWLLISGEFVVGRVLRDRSRPQAGRYSWSLTGPHGSPVANHGMVDTFEEAQTRCWQTGGGGSSGRVCAMPSLCVLQWVSAGFALAAAFLWLASALVATPSTFRITVNTWFDVEMPAASSAELNRLARALHSQSRLSAAAALCAAVAAGTQGAVLLVTPGLCP